MQASSDIPTDVMAVSSNKAIKISVSIEIPATVTGPQTIEVPVSIEVPSSIEILSNKATLLREIESQGIICAWSARRDSAGTVSLASGSAINTARICDTTHYPTTIPNNLDLIKYSDRIAAAKMLFRNDVRPLDMSTSYAAASDEETTFSDDEDSSSDTSSEAVEKFIEITLSIDIPASFKGPKILDIPATIEVPISDDARIHSMYPTTIEIPVHDEDQTLIPANKTIVLRKHELAAVACSWGPSTELLASGSGDSTVRIFDMTDSPTTIPNEVVLKHSVRIFGANVPKNKDVTCIAWNGEGTRLATGSFDGYVRIWKPDGVLATTVGQHGGPVFAVKWNARGNYILSAGVDYTAVWDTSTGWRVHKYAFHRGPALDVDWQTNISFASCSTDQSIRVCKVHSDKPIRSFLGHTGEINAVQWDPQGEILASCSDDTSLKIWTMNQDTCVYDLLAHTRQVHTITWSPTGPESPNPNMDLILASASFDTTVKLWNVELGYCIDTLRRHTKPVFSVAFSPDSKFLASGSTDRSVHIYSARTGELVHSYMASGGVYEVCWNSSGNKVAACATDGSVSVLDLRKAKK